MAREVRKERCTYKLNLRFFCTIIVAVDKQYVSHTLSVCL